jgi:hypothetical protein
VGGSGNGLVVANLAAGPSAADNQQFASASALSHYHHNLNARIPQHIGGMGPAAAVASENDETALFL